MEIVDAMSKYQSNADVVNKQLKRNVEDKLYA
jgi:hypothetical protein